MPGHRTPALLYLVISIALSFITASVEDVSATFTSCATDWNNFANNPGYIADYTYKGTPIKDHESVGSGDPSRGPANVPPASTDLASNASAGTNPGAQTTPFFGYYDGGTPYDQTATHMCSVSKTNCVTNNDCTGGAGTCIGKWEDDYIFFRMRVSGDPRAGGNNPPDFDSYHWNVLFDVDADGYKEYWVDLEGSCTNQVCGGNYDRLNVLYNNDNRQDIADPDAAGVRVAYFQARNAADPNATCPNGYSHTRSYAVPDGSGDWYIEIQVPMTAFDDSFGNQVLYPNSPVAFVFSTGASNQNPLQKDHMMDLKMLSLSDPITFGDVVKPNGEPQIYFTNINFDHVDFYAGPAGDSIYVYVTDRFANTDRVTVQTITVTVTNPATGDDQQITLTETGPNTGIFTSGALATVASDGIQNNSDNNSYLEVTAGDVIQVSYTNSQSMTVTDHADIVGACQAYMQFTRANGLPTESYQLTTSRTTSDKVYVTVTHREANTNPATLQTITVNLTGTSGDLRTLTLTETGVNTGIFRNTTGQDTEVATAPIDTTDDLWEDNDGGRVTVSYSYGILGSCPAGSATPTTANIFYTSSAGRIYFTNSTGVFDVDIYTNNQPVYLKVVDANACALPSCNCSTIGGVRTFTVIVTSDVVGESETVRLYETAPNSNVFMNTVASPLTAVTYDGAYIVNDTYIEANNAATIRASYYDCSDGDSNSGNDSKTDTASYNVPPLIINSVLFYPDHSYAVDIGGGTSSTCQTEYVELLNNTSNPVNATGYFIRDEDSQLNYTVPQYNGSNIVLQPGEKIIVSLYSTAFGSRNTKIGDTYYLFDTTSPSFPANYLGDPKNCSVTTNLSCSADSDCPSGQTCVASTDPADQVTLYNSSGQAVDYLGWSTKPDNSLDFLSDDTSAVLRNIWQDDAFKNVSTIQKGYALQRSPSGYDTNTVSDWSAASGKSTVCSIVVTRAAVSSFSAAEYDGSVVLGWETVSEVGTVGFSLLRRDLSTGVTEQVNSGVLPAVIGSPFGGKYSLTDINAYPKGSYEYELVELDAHGRKRHVKFAYFNASEARPLKTTFAPSLPAAAGGDQEAYKVVRDDGTIVLTNRPAGSMGEYWAALVKKGSLSRYVDSDGSLVTSNLSPSDRKQQSAVAAYAVERKRPSESMDIRSAQLEVRKPVPVEYSPYSSTTAKISVDRDGIYFLSALQIGPLFGKDAAQAKKIIASRYLHLSNRGLEIPYFPAADLSGIYFFGMAINSIYTTDNVYWLSVKPGKVMESIAGNAPAPVEYLTTFIETGRHEENRIMAPHYSHDPDSDYWFWDFIFANYPGFDQKVITFESPGVFPSEERAYLTIDLHGGTDSAVPADHHAIFSVNGSFIGEAKWKGIKRHSVILPVRHDLLNDGSNTLTVNGEIGPGIPYSIFYIDAVSLTYERKAVAAGNALTITAYGHEPVTIPGFTSPNIAVFDITDPVNPGVLNSLTYDGAQGNYRVTFTTEHQRKYAALVSAAAMPVKKAVSDSPSALKSWANAADYIIITSPQLAAAAQGLTRYRSGQGLRTMIVTVEDIMDEFNYGIYDPHAIRSFLSHAKTKWTVPPRFVLLAGEGTYDYRDVTGIGDNLVPTLLVNTPDGLFPSDNQLVDFNGDHVPDIAIGRLPVLTAQELKDVTAKIIAYESRLYQGLGPKALVLADDPAPGADFTGDSDGIASILQTRFGTERIYLGNQSVDSARSMLFGSLANGADLINYIGHGGLDRLADEGLLIYSDVASLNNSERTPVLLALTCVTGLYAYPGYDTLSEALILKPSGGTVAVWVPTGLSNNAQAVMLNREFVKNPLVSGSYRKISGTLGETISQSLLKAMRLGLNPYMLDIYTLLGDPATRLP